MLKVVIIDDDLEFCNSFKQVLDQNISKIASTYMIDVISKDFINSLNVLDYDIIFLDIDLKGANGIALAHTISKLRKKTTIIIFVSSRNDLVFESLSVQPFHFIRKSNMIDDLFITTTLLKKYYNQNARFITLKYKGRKTSIKKSDIVYIESDFHDIYISTLLDQYTYRSTLKGILEALNCKCFVRIQKSIAINLDYVKEIDENYNVILTTGNCFSINRHYKKQVLEDFKEYLLLC